ncbi:MAG: DUF4355 domain-containing protein [Ruminiclostridium sp.]|nr:DUF4355 domain-containing protein [Ruminiclostridium sp.]
MQENEILTEEVDEEKGSEPSGEKLYTQSQLDELLGAEREQLAKKLAEAEKLAAMSEAARTDYRREMREKELSEREAAVEKRELMADALELLEAAGLPKQLAACLNYSGREMCDRSIEAVGTAFESAVAAAVNERIRGKTPKISSGGTNDAFLAGLGM